MREHGTAHKFQLSRLNRIEGQVRGIKDMIEDQRYCMDILTQLKAVKSALSSVEANIMEEHLNHCVTNAMGAESKGQRSKIVSEIKDLIKSFNK